MLLLITGNKKPQFKLQLVINDLTNIPQISGYCYIELLIRNTQHAHKPHAKKSKLVDADDDAEYEKISGTVSGSTVKTATSKHKIHNFKCNFNYSLSCNLKFPYKKSENLVGNKYLSMTVFYLSSDNSDIVTIGKTDVNLTEYLNFKDPVTSKYLLKDSKVNSILSLTVGLSELPADMDFHTQLQINDSTAPSIHGSVANNLSSDTVVTRPTTFNIPQFDRKNVFTGLNGVMVHDSDDSNKLNPSSVKKPMSQTSSDNSSGKGPLKSKFNIKSSITIKSDNDKSKPALSSQSEKADTVPVQSQNQQSSIIMDPIVSGLYKKILESTWDPELHSLLDYTPEKCINDIFEYTDNPLGWCPYVSKKFGTWADEGESDEEGDNVKDLNGLLSEVKLREDLKSWSIRVEQES
jgi:hypothetical protein